jgi:tetratricopeptide (TPR) repeat protein
MRSLRVFWSSLLLALPASQPAMGQNAASPDSLTSRVPAGSVTGIQSLRQAADSFDHPPGGLSTARDWTRAGLARLVLAARTGDYGDFRAAILRLDRAVLRDSRYVAGWHALGLARLAMADQGFTAKPGPLLEVGESYADGAANAFLRALEIQPSFLPAAQGLAGLVGRRDLRLRRDLMLTALQRAGDAGGQGSSDIVITKAWLTAARGDTAEALADLLAFSRTASMDPVQSGLPREPGLAPVLFEQAELELLQDNPDSALVSLARYLAAGGDSGLGRHEQARALFAQGRPDVAESIYYLGARSATSAAARALYRYQVHWTAHPGEMEALDSVAADSLEPWFRAFWDRRDAEDGRSGGSRLAEHFRRWEFALAHFSPPGRRGPRGPGWSYPSVPTEDLIEQVNGMAPPTGENIYNPFDYRFRERGSDDPTLDDRGAVYMRYGEPDARVKYPIFQQAYAASWLYGADGGPLLFHFKDIPFDGVIAPTTLSALPAGDLDEACRIDRAICRVATSINLGVVPPPDKVQAIIQRSRADIMRGMRADGFPPRFSRGLGPVVQLYGLPAIRGDSARLLAVFAIPGDSLSARPEPDGQAAYPLLIRLSAYGEDRRLHQRDTLRTFATPAPLHRGEMLAGVEQLPVPVGTYLATLSLSADTTAGSLSRLPELEIPALGGDHLAIGGLLLGRAESALRIRHGGEEISLNPGNAYRQDDPAEVYYFLAGTDPDRRYLTTIELRRANGKPVSTTGFEETGSAGPVMLRRTLDLTRIPPGSYLLAVSVRDPVTGAVATQQQRLNVTRR